MARINDRTGQREETPRPSPSTGAAPAPAAPPAPATNGAAGRFGKPDLARSAAGAVAVAATTATVGGVYPVLVAFLTDRTWSDGSMRIPGTLTVFVECNQWKACLSCRSSSRKAFLSAGSLQELLETLETNLGSDELDWRRDGSVRR